MNMPPEREARIRAIPGNKTCADCSNINPQWASVSYGILVCLECSGHHRALGVHLSFVRSVQMDSWTEKQMEAMERSGGNVALEKFLSSRGIMKNWPVAAKYGTKQAAYYRERLSRWLDGKTEPPPDPGNYDPVSGGDAQGAEPLPGESTDDYNARQARLREAARERLRAKFGDGAMGGVGSSGATSYGTSSGGVEDWGLGEIGEKSCSGYEHERKSSARNEKGDQGSQTWCQTHSARKIVQIRYRMLQYLEGPCYHGELRREGGKCLDLVLVWTVLALQSQ